MSIKNIIFVFGIDKKAITLALKNRYNNESNKAESFLEKIFPVSFNISHEIPCIENIDILIKRCFEHLSIEQYGNIRKFLNDLNIINPRKIIKVVNKYKILEEELKIQKLLNPTNEWNIMLLLFLIIEHEFNIDNYINMLKNNKKHILGNKVKLNFDGVSGFHRKNIGYEEFSICLRIKKDDERESEKVEYRNYPIYLFEYFSNPANLIKNEIPVFDFSTGHWIEIKFEIWMESFGNSINKQFCYWLKENWKDIIRCFSNEDDKDNYEVFIKNVNELVYQLDLLL